MKKIIFIAMSIFALLFMDSIQTNADSFRPATAFEVTSNDGTMVFRWVPSYPRPFTAQATMYRNGDAIYTIENMPATGIGAWSFFFSQDFEHFIFIPTTGFYVAMEFYSNGELVKTYYIDDLIEDMYNVGRSVSMAFWRGEFPDRRSSTEHIIEQDILRIITVEEVIFDFDLTSGVILSSTVSEPIIYVPVNDGIIRVYLNGQAIAFPDQSPVIVNDRTLVPIRGVFEEMGFAVTWDESTSTVLLNDGRTVISITVGQLYFKRIVDINEPDYYYVYWLDVPSRIIGGRTMIPLRAISVSIGANVRWEPLYNKVVITTSL